MFTFVRYLFSLLKNLISILRNKSNAPSTAQNNHKPAQVETVSDVPVSTSAQYELNEKRLEWIDQMIQLVPAFMDDHMSPSGAFLNNFFFHFLADQQTIIFRVSSCACGACDNDLKQEFILGRFSEEDWAIFWPIAIGKLEFYKRHSTNDRFRNHITIWHRPDHLTSQVDQCVHPILIGWSLAPRLTSIHRNVLPLFYENDDNQERVLH